MTNVKQKLTIPEVRDRLYQLSHERKDAELGYLATQLHRRQLRPKAPPKSLPMTPERAEAIRQYAAVGKRKPEAA